MAFLEQPRIVELARAIALAGLYDAVWRDNLLAGIDRAYTLAHLPAGAAPLPQALADLGRMNDVRLADGTVPIQIWLQNAVAFTDRLDDNRLFRAALDTVMHRTSGQPRVAPDVKALPEMKERLIFRNDMVAFAFLQQGHHAGRAVARLHVPRFDQGNQRMMGADPALYLGTGWLLTPRLLMTNHHVLLARDDGEPPASAADFSTQAAGTRAQFDYDGENAAGRWVDCVGVEAADATLDYAVLRLAADAPAPPLAISAAALTLADGDYVPVNIIQHPQGWPKRVGLRNNLVSRTTATDVRYFTDTLPGSSGAPVLDDTWRVVALHRGAESVENVQFQGRTTAWVNVGTQLAAILADIGGRNSALLDEIRTDNPPL